MANALTRFLFDPVDADRERAPRRYQFTGDARWWTVPVGVGVVGLAIAAAVGLADLPRFLFAYLIAWAFCVSVALGALFFVMFHHITKARWSTTIRRIPEAIAANFPLLALAGIPVLLGMHDLYHWTHHSLYEPGGDFDQVLAGKSAYFFWPAHAGGLPVFFLARYVLYFGLWTLIAHKLYAYSVRNDTAPDPENTLKLRWWSALGIPLTGVTMAFAAYDFVMSTDPHWFSTMFGVYYFAGGWLGALCLITFLALLLKKGGMLDQEVSREHIQDMGKYMMAFVVFWTYIAFSQYMLYWYANLPEEIVWFQKRFAEGWGVVAWSLLIFHFVLPFLILLPRASKRVYPVLATMAVWLLVMHWVDLWWVTMPAMLPTGVPHVDPEHARALLGQGGDLLASLQPFSEAVPQVETPGFVRPSPEMTVAVVPPAFPVVEFVTWIGLFALFIGATLVRLGRHALTPHSDPYFADSLRFENV